jgi:hypothetical protein
VTTSDDDEALRLNTLHRFRKHSPRLLLQEYSHCEVPAGCGGVVLRWLDRQAGLPAVVRVAALGKVRCWFNGEEVRSSRIELQAGRHALAVEISDLPRAGTPMLAQIQVNLPRDDATLVQTLGDSTWYVIDFEPAGSWTKPLYDPPHSGWSRALHHPDYEAEVPENERWRWSSLVRNATPIVLPGTHAWLHHEFFVSAEDIAQRLAAAEERSRG